MRGGFKSVELNAVGWTAVLLPGALVGGAVGRMAGPMAGLVGGAIVGPVVSFLFARGLDEVRDRRRLQNVAVVEADRAVAQLRSAGIRAAGAVSVGSDDRLEYVTVRERDALLARDLVGLRRESRRAGRRARAADARVMRLPRVSPR